MMMMMIITLSSVDSMIQRHISLSVQCQLKKRKKEKKRYKCQKKIENDPAIHSQTVTQEASHVTWGQRGCALLRKVQGISSLRFQKKRFGDILKAKYE